jgi:hypothetical protein
MSAVFRPGTACPLARPQGYGYARKISQNITLGTSAYWLLEYCLPNPREIELQTNDSRRS